MLLAILKKLRIVCEPTLTIIFNQQIEDLKSESNPQEQEANVLIIKHARRNSSRII